MKQPGQGKNDWDIEKRLWKSVEKAL